MPPLAQSGFTLDFPESTLGSAGDQGHMLGVIAATVRATEIAHDLPMDFHIGPRPTHNTQVPTEQMSLNYEEIKVTYNTRDGNHDKWIDILSW